MKPSVLALTLICLSAVPASAQQVYSWTDANGTKHFSDTPPPPNTKSAKKLIVQGGVTSEQAETEAAASETKEGPAMAAAAGYSSEDITRNCAAARQNLDAYNAVKPDEDAEPQVKVDYQENVNKAMAQIKLFCG
jgi:hypothetical protein